MGDFKEWGWGEDFEMGREEVDILLQTMVFEKPENTVIQPRQVVQRESNNESKSTKSIPTLYKKYLIHFNSVIYIDKTHIAVISRLLIHTTKHIYIYNTFKKKYI